MRDLFDRCEDCGHRSFHPIRWIKSLFIKPKYSWPGIYGSLPPGMGKYIAEQLIKSLQSLEKFSEIRPLPENKSGKITFRRYRDDRN